MKKPRTNKRAKGKSVVMMPNPEFVKLAKTASGHRFNNIFLDEFTKVQVDSFGKLLSR